jgi:hypothetical protein
MKNQLVLHILGVVVALIIQYEKRMHRILLLYVACLDIPYISTLSHKQHELPNVC